MIEGLQYLETAAGTTLCVWAVWHVYTLTSRSYARRKLAREARIFASRPREDDRSGGRASR